MKEYNYYNAMVNDVLSVLPDYKCELLKCNTLESCEELLYDLLWTDDSVTGNASGSHTFSNYVAKCHVFDNMKLAIDSYREFCCMDMLTTALEKEDYESIDVTIRCCLLSQVINNPKISNWIYDNILLIEEV